MRRNQGFFVLSTPCSRCRGTGRITETPCSRCRGFGKVEVRKKLSVKIPAGVDNGSHIRLQGEGEPGTHGAYPGDLFIVINVRTHDKFERHGDDLVLEIPITFAQAALGNTINIPTLEGEEPMNIPAGTQPGTVFTLNGKGVPNLRGFGRGDLHIRVAVITPTKLTPRHEELFKELAKLGGEELTKRKKSIFEKLRESIT